MKKTISFLLAASMAFTMNAQIKRVIPSARSVAEYGRLDVTVMLKGNFENPCLQEQAALDMIVTTPSGKRLSLPCFHKSGESGAISLWEARFTPQEKGRYSYSFVYTEKGEKVSRSGRRTFKATEPKSSGILHINGDWTLKADDGTLFRGIGENICWESRTVDDSKYFKELHEDADRFSYPLMFPKFTENGGNFTRIWMNSWNFPIDRKKDFNNRRYTDSDGFINESAVRRLDETIELSEKLGLKIMLCIGAGEQRTDAEFFSGDAQKALHRNRLRYIVARWGYSESIAMFEFFNEIDNIQYNGRTTPIASEDITRWHTEMSKYLKSIDPYGHIVTTSISHRDVEGLNEVEDIDINQKHIYNNTDVIPRTIASYVQRYGKPYVIGEFGFEWDWSKNFDDFAEDMDNDFRRGLWYGIFSPTPVTPMSWWWEYFDNRNMVPYFKNARFISDMMLETGNGSFEPVAAAAGRAQSFSVKCGDVTYLYVYNPSEDSVTSATVSGVNASKVETLNMDSTSLSSVDFVNGNGSVTIPCSIGHKGEALFVIKVI